MIFHRAAQREFAQTALAVFVALFAILVTTHLIRLLGQAASGRTPSEAVLAMLGFAALQYLPVLLSLTLFVAILLSLSRMYRDSEMSIWFTSGLPLTAWIAPVLRFALPVVLFIAVLSFFLTPWSMSLRDDFQHRMNERDDMARMTPGAFRESSRGDRVFFVEAVGGEEVGTPAQVHNIFVSSTQQGRQGVIVAAEGYAEIAKNGDRFVVLGNGRRYEGVAGEKAYRVVEFERYAIRMESAETQTLEVKPRTETTLHLLQQPSASNRGELLWRIGVPLSALTLSLLAIPLSFVNPRAGRTNNLLLALLTFMIYNNLLSISQAWVAGGRMSFVVGIWAAHLLMGGVLILLFWKRLAVFSVWQRWR